MLHKDGAALEKFLSEDLTYIHFACVGKRCGRLEDGGSSSYPAHPDKVIALKLFLQPRIAARGQTHLQPGANTLGSDGQ